MATASFTFAGLQTNNQGNIFSTIAQWLEQRRSFNRTVRELQNLTDRELDDLGVCRADIYSIARSAALGQRR